MRKILAVSLALFGLALGTQAQNTKVIDVPVPDPYNFVLQPLSAVGNFQSAVNFFISIPPGQNSLSLLLTGLTTNAGNDIFLWSGTCVASNVASDTTVALNQTFLMWGMQRSNGGGTTFSISQSPSIGPNAPVMIATSVAGCQRIEIGVNYSSGAVTDQVQFIGNFSTTPLAMPGGGLAVTAIGYQGGAGGGNAKPAFNLDSAGSGLIVDIASGINAANDNFSMFGFFSASNGQAASGVTSPCLANSFTNCLDQPAGETFAFQNGIAATTTQVIAQAGAGTRQHITAVILSNNSATATTATIVSGTGTNCGTGTTSISGLINLPANTTNNTVELTFPGVGLRPALAQAICITGGAAGAISAHFQYSVY